jgi:hypothetical protein
LIEYSDGAALGVQQQGYITGQYVQCRPQVRRFSQLAAQPAHLMTVLFHIRRLSCNRLSVNDEFHSVAMNKCGLTLQNMQALMNKLDSTTGAIL